MRRRLQGSTLANRIRNKSLLNFQLKLAQSISLILIISSEIQSNDSVNHENLCLEDDNTNDLPIFVDKRTMCNYETAPVHVYSIKTTPEAKESIFCLKGENAEKFNITKEREIELIERLSQPETDLRLQIIGSIGNGTPSERRQAINAIKFILSVDDCNRISWQTIVVAVLSSICVVLMSTLAIMLILYQQKGLIRSSNDDERADERVAYASDLRDESFINPRRTSSYEFSSLSRHSASTIERQEAENP